MKELSALAKKRRRIVSMIEQAILGTALAGVLVIASLIAELLCRLLGCGA